MPPFFIALFTPLFNFSFNFPFNSPSLLSLVNGFPNDLYPMRDH